MPRYSDKWLIDKTLFDYISGGSCACCGGFLFMPGGTKGLIESLSEFETDAANAEVSALDRLPWPQDMKDEVWKERVRLRQYCKRNMKTYSSFWEKHEKEYQLWFYQLPKQKLCRIFQLARTEIMERLQQQKFHFHAAFGTVLCAVTEQVAHFDITKYPIDGRGDAEIGFEDILVFDRRGGFTIRDDTEETRRKWLLRHKKLGGPKLLERNAKKITNNDEDDNDDSDSDNDNEEEEEEEEEVDDTADTNTNEVDDTPSFRSDRRIVRLLIARCFADTIQQAFLKSTMASSSKE